MAHHSAAVRNGQHGPNGNEANCRRKRVKEVEAMHLSEAARNQPRLVLVKTAICISLCDENPLARN